MMGSPDKIKAIESQISALQKELDGLKLSASLDEGVIDRKPEDLQLNLGFHQFVVSRNDVVYELDNHGNILYITPSVESIFGYKVDEVIHQNVLSFVYAEDRERMAALLSKETSHDVSTHQFRFLDQSGVAVWVSTTTFTTKEPDGRVRKIGVLNNITDSVYQNYQIKKLSYVVDKSPVSVIITNKEGIIEYCNSSYEMVTGYPSSELIGKSTRIFKSGEMNPAVYEDLWATILKGETWRGELLNKKKDGSLFWEEVSIKPIFSSELGLINYLAIKQDITEKKKREFELKDINKELEQQAVQRSIELAESNEILQRKIAEIQEVENALRKSEANFRMVIENIKEVVFQTDAKGNWTFLNGVWETFTGYTVNESLGENFLNWVIPEDREENIQHFTVLIEERRSFCNHAFRYKKKNGGIIWIDAFTRLSFDESGNLIGTYGTLRDITSQKYEQNFQDALLRLTPQLTGFPIDKLDDTLNLALEEIGKALNSDRAYIFEFTEADCMTNTYEWCNAGISPEKDNLKDIPVSIFPNWMATLNRLEEIIIPLVADLGEGWEAEKEILEPQGIQSLIVLPIIQESVVIGFFGLDSVQEARAFNETELTYLRIWVGVMGGLIKQRRTEELRQIYEHELLKATADAEKANMAKSEFLSRMSHELRTPLNSILGFAQLLEMDELRKNQVVGVQHILKSGRHLLNLINEVLDIAKIESGRIELMPVKLDLVQVIQEMQAMFHNSFLQKSILFQFEYNRDENYQIMADPHRMKQIIINLLSNAVKYNNEGGIVSITIQREYSKRKDVIRISVKDSGIGISAENLSKLFSPFERLGAEFSAIEGTGLGLSVVKKIVDAMGGEVGVESRLNEGSTFWIDLPALTVSARSLESAEFNPNDVRTQFGKVLYIEDNQSNIDLISQTMNLLRPNIQMISNYYGQNAVPLSLQHKPDIILLDLNLPDISGDIVIDLLDHERHLRQIPVVVISANATPDSIHQLKKKRIVDYLTKPVDLEQLLVIIDKFTIKET